MREPAPSPRWSLTLILIVINVAAYALELILNLVSPRTGWAVMNYLALSPEGLLQGWFWQLITFQFMHGGPLHLLLNCAMLYMFGRPMEEGLGRPLFLRLYLVSGVIGGLLQVSLTWLFPTHFGSHAVVGASAGLFGLVAAFAFLNREASITSFIALVIPVTMKAKYLLVVESVIALIGILGPPDGVAHAAHLGGMLAALAYLQTRLVVARRRTADGIRRAAPPRPELVTAPMPRAPQRQQRQTAAPPLRPDFMSVEVDPILEKISAHGIQSLTERERRILELARDRMNKG